MKKNHLNLQKWGRKMKFVLQLCIVILFLPIPGHGAVNPVTQQKLINLSMKDVTLKEVMWEIEKQTDFVFAYNATDLEKVGKISIDVENKTVEDALKICLKNTKLTYVLQQNIIVIKQEGQQSTLEIKKITVKGKVMDRDSVPLPGVTILVKGTNVGVISDANGNYLITIPNVTNPVLVFSFIGKRKKK